MQRSLAALTEEPARHLELMARVTCLESTIMHIVYITVKSTYLYKDYLALFNGLISHNRGRGDSVL